jgi:hypothetical protein
MGEARFEGIGRRRPLLGEESGAIPSQRCAGKQVDIDGSFARRDAGGDQPRPRSGKRLEKGFGSHPVYASTCEACFSFSAL